MRKEKNIGGAFSLLDVDVFISRQQGDFRIFFPDQLNGSQRMLFETGIDAFAYILREIFQIQRATKTVFIPLHFCGDSINRMTEKAPEAFVKRYRNTEELLSQKKDNDIVLWTHFNRYCAPPEALLRSDIILIEDFVQAPLDMPKSKSKYSFTSLRKLCNLEVAVCYSGNAINYEAVKISDYYLSKKKAEITKHYFQQIEEVLLEELFLDEFRQAEQWLMNSAISPSNLLERTRFCHLTFSTILSLRKENYEFVKNKLQELGIYRIIEGDYMYVMLALEERDKMRKRLAQNGIFTTVHWQDSVDTEKAASYLTLYIDQRYTKADMLRIVNVISNTTHAS